MLPSKGRAVTAVLPTSGRAFQLNKCLAIVAQLSSALVSSGKGEIRRPKKYTRWLSGSGWRSVIRVVVQEADGREREGTQGSRQTKLD